MSKEEAHPPASRAAPRPALSTEEGAGDGFVVSYEAGSYDHSSVYSGPANPGSGVGGGSMIKEERTVSRAGCACACSKCPHHFPRSPEPPVAAELFFRPSLGGQQRCFANAE